MDRTIELVSICKSKYNLSISNVKNANERLECNINATYLLHSICELDKLISENSNYQTINNILLENVNAIQSEFSLKQDSLDCKAQQLIKSCHDSVLKFQSSFETLEINSIQCKHHLTNTLYLLEKYLERVISGYSAVRAQRLEHLQTIKNAFSISFHFNEISLDDMESNFKLDASDNSQSDISVESDPLEGDSISNVLRRRRNLKKIETKSLNLTHQKANNLTFENTSSSSFEEYKTEEDIRLEQENIQLVREMTTQFDEIKNIQNKLHQISTLQSIVSEEVMRQKEDIQVIADVTDESAVNIEEGNRQIKKAIEKQFTSDSVVLFVIIILTLAVIYLDWFQD